jgi:hypothetical protein
MKWSGTNNSKFLQTDFSCNDTPATAATISEPIKDTLAQILREVDVDYLQVQFCHLLKLRVLTHVDYL